MFIENKNTQTDYLKKKRIFFIDFELEIYVQELIKKY